MRHILIAILAAISISSYAQTSEPKEIIAEYYYSEFGDLPHIVFIDMDGNEYDFGEGENEFGEFDFGQDNEFTTNEDLVGRIFKISYANKKVRAYAEDMETVIEVEMPSILKIELIR